MNIIHMLVVLALAALRRLDVEDWVAGRTGYAL